MGPVGLLQVLQLQNLILPLKIKPLHLSFQFNLFSNAQGPGPIAREVILWMQCSLLSDKEFQLLSRTHTKGSLVSISQ